MSGHIQKWQYLDHAGKPTPYFVPADSPNATPHFSNNQFFPERRQAPSVAERFAQMKAALVQIAHSKNVPNGGEEVERGDVKSALTEAELREQDEREFTAEPPKVLSYAQKVSWLTNHKALFGYNEPAEPDPERKRARGELRKLKKLAELYGKGLYAEDGEQKRG